MAGRRQAIVLVAAAAMSGIWSELDADDMLQSMPDLQISASPVLKGSEATAYGGWVSTVDRAQIEDLNAQDLASALRRTPGVTISRYNRVGSFGGGDGGAVFIRGHGATRPGADLVTMIDGVPVLNPVWNHPLLDLNPIDVAQSIQVFKGPHPAEFGNAFSAVNMIPERLPQEGVANRLRLAYGSDSTWIWSGDHAGRCGPADWGIGGSFRRSDGHRIDADGRLGDVRLRAGYDLDPHWRATTFVLRTASSASDPGPIGMPDARDGQYETRQWLAMATLRHDYDAVSGRMTVFGSRGNGEWYDQAGAADDTLNDWRTLGLRWQEDLILADSTDMRIGLDQDVLYGEATFTTDAGARSRFPETRLALTSPYAALRHRVDLGSGLYATPSAGIRYYSHNEFDAEWSPHAGIEVGFKETVWHVSYARGVSYPGMNVIVFSEHVLVPLATSWQDLDAEAVHHWEAGVRRPLGQHVDASVTFFHDDGQDRYVFYRSAPTPGPPNRWANTGEYTLRGIEGELHIRPSRHLALFVGVTGLDADPGDLPYTPSWTAAAGVNLALTERIRWTIDASYVDDMPVLARTRLRDSLNTASVSSHILVNTKLSADVDLGSHVDATFFIAVENLTDTDYEYLPGYPMPGISPMAGVDVRF